jgi:hypothetical protein
MKMRWSLRNSFEVGHKPVTGISKLGTTTHHDAQDIRTSPIRINWDGEPFGIYRKSGKYDFSLKIGYIGSLQFSCYYL